MTLVEHMTTTDNGHVWRQLRERPVDGGLWLALAQGYAQEHLPWHLAYAKTQAERCWRATGSGGDAARAQADSLRCASAPHWAAQEVLSQPRAHWDGRDAVRAQLQAHLQANPGDWLSWLYLSRCLEMEEDAAPPPGAAAGKTSRWEAVRQALDSEVIPGETGHHLALWRLRSGDLAGALDAVQAVLLRAPQRYGTWLLSAEALMQLGREQEAMRAFEQAGRSQIPRLLELVADKLFSFNFAHEALTVREAVVRLEPNNAAAWNTLGQLQKTMCQSAAARYSLEQALRLKPEDTVARDTLREIAQAGTSREEFEERLKSFEEGTVSPNGQGMPRMMMLSLYQNHLSARRVARLHQQVGDALQAEVDAALGRPPARLPARSSEGRRLRVGYVSGDLHRQHPVNIFALPILRRHDRSRLEVFIYHTGDFVDEYTREAKRCVDHWREVKHLSDAVLRQMIEDDGVDVLVDLAGHTATARLGVFAMRAAPVQLTYLGYPHSTGLKCMDWLIADEVVAPVEHEDLFTERVARVSGCVFAWSPDEEDYPLPTVPQPPGRPVTFGCFNNLLKVTDEVLAVWGRVLAAAPGTRLLLKAPILGDPDIASSTLRRLERSGVDTGRVEVRGPTGLSDMMQEYGDVDIALDPFPYNGGTTSLQALWMGCPMVVMAGHNFVSRMGMSFLTNLGRTEWIAQDADGYVRIAARLAAQVAREGWDRAAFRRLMRSSPVCDIDLQTRDIEDIYFAAHEAALAVAA